MQCEQTPDQKTTTAPFFPSRAVASATWPPFTAGSPKTAEPEIVETVIGMLKGLGDSGLDAMIATARKARAERVQ